jgi:uncharacterized protein (DUF362 family)
MGRIARRDGVSRREFLVVGAGATAASWLVPQVFAAPDKPGMVVVRGGAALAPEEAAYRRLKTATARLGGLGAVVKGKRVLVKVNATERSSEHANTSVAATQGFLRLCQECAPAGITVLGQEWGGFDSPRPGQPTLRQVIKDSGATLLELPHYWTANAADLYTARNPQGDVWHDLRVAKVIFEPDTVLINLARLKSHPHCVYTGCVKNVIGLTMRMYGFHKIDDVEGPKNAGDPADSDGWHVFPQKLGLAYRDVIGPRIALNILDAGQPTFGWRGPGPERLQTFDANVTIVGADALAIDVYGCGLLRAQRPDVYLEPLGDWGQGSSPYVAGNKTKGNYLVECGKLGVGETDLKKVDIDEATVD